MKRRKSCLTCELLGRCLQALLELIAVKGVKFPSASSNFEESNDVAWINVF